MNILVITIVMPTLRGSAVWAQKRVESGETPTFVWQSGEACRAKKSAWYCDSANEPTYYPKAEDETPAANSFVIGLKRDGQAAAHYALSRDYAHRAARYTAPVGVLIAPLRLPEFQIVQS